MPRPHKAHQACRHYQGRYDKGHLLVIFIIYIRFNPLNNIYKSTYQISVNTLYLRIIIIINNLFYSHYYHLINRNQCHLAILDSMLVLEPYNLECSTCEICLLVRS